MKIHSRNVLLFGVALIAASPSMVRANGSPNFREDVALDLVTGDTFIVDQDGQFNTKGEITILNDHDASYSQTVYVGAADRFEIEKISEDRLAYLVEREGYWAVSLIERSASGDWQIGKASHAVGGVGAAAGLHSIPGGDLVVSTGDKVLKIAQAGNGSLSVVDQVDSVDFESAASEVQQAVVAKDGQQQPKAYDSGNGMGFAAGYQSGVGIAYRRHLKNKWGIQVAAGGWGDADSIFVNGGATVMRTLSKSEIVRFYAMGGAGVFLSTSSYENWVCPTDGSECTVDGKITTSSTMLNIGVGLGIEFRILKRVGIAIEVPITTSVIVSGTDNTGFNGITMIPNGSLIYYF
ncbi:MAG: hypothetical protein AAB425_13010 [Bdellovibrionota bacterium]